MQTIWHEINRTRCKDQKIPFVSDAYVIKTKACPKTHIIVLWTCKSLICLEYGKRHGTWKRNINTYNKYTKPTIKSFHQGITIWGILCTCGKIVALEGRMTLKLYPTLLKDIIIPEDNRLNSAVFHFQQDSTPIMYRAKIVTN